MVEIVSAKLISHVLVDFTSESDMELYISKFEKIGDDFYISLKKIGLIDKVKVKGKSEEVSIYTV